MSCTETAGPFLRLFLITCYSNLADLGFYSLLFLSVRYTFVIIFVRFSSNVCKQFFCTIAFPCVNIVSFAKVSENSFINGIDGFQIP